LSGAPVPEERPNPAVVNGAFFPMARKTKDFSIIHEIDPQGEQPRKKTNSVVHRIKSRDQ
jgi:hypothetical protein